MQQLILASASPRRKEILEELGFSFQVIPSNFDESTVNESDVRRLVAKLASEEARVVARQFSSKPNNWILGADSLVEVGGQILGKPKDILDAKRMIRLLSGKSHEGYTGLCLLNAQSGLSYSKCAQSTVKLRELSESEVVDFVYKTHPYDKAGGYKFTQLVEFGFVESLVGESSNLMGLPQNEFLELAAKAGLQRRARNASEQKIGD
ncbi:septum formation protein Maf [Candidatus Micrarchaeota archaeon]|nr:septum formation protein Maf [Candidatus Micrarchaeota archaeon]